MTAHTSPAAAGPDALPVHVAIIMDGNGRWAAGRGLPRVAGHRQGAAAARAVVVAAMDLGIRYLTLYGFSSENWNRPEPEVADLMGLLRLYLRREIDGLDREGVRLRFIGDRTPLAADIVSLIEMAERRTRRNARLELLLALSYSGRQEIVSVARSLAEDAVRDRVDPAMIDEAAFSARLFTAGVPDPDLVIRTSGEQRISNFLLWQSAYAEFVFTDVLWPDFARSDLERAVAEFGCRERRYGAVSG